MANTFAGTLWEWSSEDHIHQLYKLCTTAYSERFPVLLQTKKVLNQEIKYTGFLNGASQAERSLSGLKKNFFV